MDPGKHLHADFRLLHLLFGGLLLLARDIARRPRRLDAAKAEAAEMHADRLCDAEAGIDDLRMIAIAMRKRVPSGVPAGASAAVSA